MTYRQVMKTRILIIATILTTLLSCDRVYINGDLDGMWQLQRVEMNEGNHYPTGIYYSFQRHMVQVSKHYEEKLPERYIGNLHYKGDTLGISGLRKYLEEEKLCPQNLLDEFCLYNDRVTFTIDVLDSETLVLQGDSGRYYLKKW